MESKRTKLLASCVIAVMIVAGMAAAGITTTAQDYKKGLVIDFGYWDVVWTEMSLESGMNGMDVLKEACHMNGFEVTFLDEEETELYSIDEQISLTGVEWTFYVLPSNGTQWVERDPMEISATDYDLLAWARSSGPDSVIPGKDASGFNYYSYAVDGHSVKNGNSLKIVSLAPSITEMICSVGGLDMIIGTDLYSNYPSEVVSRKESGEISVIGGYTDPNYEWIIRLGPDIVFCDAGTGEHVKIADKLRKSGIDCVVLYDGESIGSMFNNMWIVASALGLEENANGSINLVRRAVESVERTIGMQTAKRVFISLSADPTPWTAGAYTYMTDVVETVSGTNVFSTQQSSWFMVSKEQIYARQPEVMIIIREREVTSEKEYKDILNGLDPLWKETPAYISGNVFIFSGDAADVLSRPGPRLSEAAELLGKALYPQAFKNKDPLDTIPKFLGDDYKTYLKYQGVTV